jgi:chromosome segregation ATPase
VKSGVEAADHRSSLRRKESDISQLKSSLRVSEQAHVAKEADMDGFRKRIDRLMADADGLKIDLAAREAEIESLRLRYNGLRSERDALRNETEAVTTRANEAEIRINQEEYKAKRLEDSLGREIASVVDKQTLIERRLQEVVRLKEKLKTKHSGRNPRSATRTVAARIVSDVKSTAPGDGSATPTPRDVDRDIARMSEEARSRSIALSDKLLKSKSGKHDEALREEIAVIAANMVALTALKEGSRSPILSLLPQPSDDGKSERQSLGDRATDLMSGHPPT